MHKTAISSSGDRVITFRESANDLVKIGMVLSN